MKIHILRTRNSITVPKLVKHLKECQEGYKYPEEKCFIVNYGRITNKTHLNNNLVNNKLKQLSILKAKGFDVPEIISFNPNYLKNWSKKAIKKILSKDFFPLMARKEKHFKGQDIIFLKNRKSLWKRIKRIITRDFLVKYIPKKAEFRVHVLGEKAGNICKKVPSEKTTKHHPHVWCSPRGWTLVDYAEEHSEALTDIGIKAVKALGYDFGAVDIGLGQDNKFYVFEVNSAPCLNKTRRRLYAQYFRQKELEYSKKCNLN